MNMYQILKKKEVIRIPAYQKTCGLTWAQRLAYGACFFTELNKADIRDATGLSRNTVIAAERELIGQGLVERHGQRLAPTGKPEWLGRTPEYVRYVKLYLKSKGSPLFAAQNYLLCLLLSLAAKKPDGLVRFHRNGLATLTGLGRGTVATSLKRFEKLGYVKLHFAQRQRDCVYIYVQDMDTEKLGIFRDRSDPSMVAIAGAAESPVSQKNGRGAGASHQTSPAVGQSEEADPLFEEVFGPVVEEYGTWMTQRNYKHADIQKVWRTVMKLGKAVRERIRKDFYSQVRWNFKELLSEAEQIRARSSNKDNFHSSAGLCRQEISRLAEPFVKGEYIPCNGDRFDGDYVRVGNCAVVVADDIHPYVDCLPEDFAVWHRALVANDYRGLLQPYFGRACKLVEDKHDLPCTVDAFTDALVEAVANGGPQRGKLFRQDIDTLKERLAAGEAR